MITLSLHLWLDPDPEEPPTALLWVWFFLSQHYDMIGDSKLSLEYINKAIDHTPTHIELYMMKSTIYKVCWNSGWMDEWMDGWMDGWING